MDYVVSTQFKQSVQKAFEKLRSQTVAHHSDALSLEKIILASQKMGQHFATHFCVLTSIHKLCMASAHHVLGRTNKCGEFYTLYKLSYRL